MPKIQCPECESYFDSETKEIFFKKGSKALTMEDLKTENETLKAEIETLKKGVKNEKGKGFFDDWQ